mmetsp:Transcript_12448/g.20390  ORF Transcript_12448/g.20390 Transcript_12448/m.20390 type:complete len:392 (+) Transcript_12448:82-1257(+)
MLGRSAWITALFLVLSVSAEIEDLSDSSCESDDLRVSLLQSSLQVAKASVKPVKKIENIENIENIDRNASIEAVKQHSRMLSPYVEASEHVKMLAQKHLSLVLQLMLPTEKTALNGIPALLVFMLAGLVMALFVVQLIGVMFDDRKEAQPFHPGHRYGYPQAPSTTGQGSLPPMTLPGSPPSRASMGPATAPSTVQNLPQRDTLGSRQSQAPPAQMCPAMIVPHADANFAIPNAGLNALITGLTGSLDGPVAVIGAQTNKPLLYARFKDVKDKRWLQLSTTSNSRFPHCCAGPLEVASDATVEIRGPRGDRFGTLEKGHDATWYMHRAEGPLVHRVYMMNGQMVAMDRSLMAGTGMFTPTAFELTVSPGRDPLLTLVSMLIIILTSPDIRR